jgi:hypothetical protein
MDGEYLLLPTENPWPKFVVPELGKPFMVSYFYLLSGPGEIQNEFFYLYEEEIESGLL